MLNAISQAWQWLLGRGRQVISAVSNGHNKPQWPPAADRARIAAYQRHENLYLGNHETVFVKSGLFQYTYDDSREYVTVNLLGALTDLLAWRMFGEGISVETPADQPAAAEFVSHLYQRNRLHELFLLSALGASYRGDAAFKVRYAANTQRVIIESVNPELLYLETDPLDAKAITAATIAQVLHDEKGRPYIWQERHELRGEASWIVNRLYRATEDDDGTLYMDPRDDQVTLDSLPYTADLPEEQATGIDELLVVHLPNQAVDNDVIWGVSAYARLLSIQGELNNRETQRAEVLDKFVDPFMFGPPLADDTGQVSLRENKYLEVPEGVTGAPAGFLVWDAQLGAVESQLRQLRESLAATAGIDVVAIMPQEQSGGPVSGRALRLQQMRTQTTVQAKQLSWTPYLQRLFSVATKLATAPQVRLAWRPTDGALEALEPEAFTPRWGDGLPTDRMEDIQEQVVMLDAGLQSRKRAVQVLQGVTGEELDTVLEQIHAEQAEERVEMPALNLAPPPEAPAEE